MQKVLKKRGRTLNFLEQHKLYMPGNSINYFVGEKRKKKKVYLESLIVAINYFGVLGGPFPT